jgi:outer membrane protein OmpA-like peptidoglycan-associated protein/tetratricopeptide (TPR) repeat protein
MRLSILLISLLLSLATVGQNKDFTKDNFPNDKEGLKEAKKALDQGYDLFEKGRGYYGKALEYLEKANAFNPNNTDLRYKLGIVSLGSGFKSRCLEHFKVAFSMDSKLKDIHYYLGRGYHLNLELDKAIEEYKTFRLELQSQKNNTDRLNEVNKLIQECEYGKGYVKKPVRVFIDNMGEVINSKYSDFSPLITADESIMYFTSKRQGSLGDPDEENGGFYEDVYFTKKENGVWNRPVNIGAPVNSDYHDATAGLSADGQKLYMFDGTSKNGDIKYTVLKGKVWGEVKNLEKDINTKERETTVCLSPDENTLFFVSEREDGKGGRDIWICKKDKKGRWNDAVNAGSVNTPYNEEGVFMHPDGKTFYFSSQGFTSMGGYDIFKTTFDAATSTWTTPENLGYPVNTADDDVFLVISANGKHGYYASFTKDGYGEKDLMMITFLGPEKPLMLLNEDNLISSQVEPITSKFVEPVVPVNPVSVTLLKGLIFDQLTQAPVEADIELVDNVKNEVIATFRSNSSSGKYLVSLPSGKNYGIAVKHPDYLFHSENFDLPANSSFQEVEKNIGLKKVAVGAKIILRNIFFDFDKASLRPESTAELERLIALLNEVSSMKIEISGHTDNKGSDDYNQKLSQSRAKAVVDYLIAHGIDNKRLEFKGFGESQPIVENETEEGRQLNRRTEFKILQK